MKALLALTALILLFPIKTNAQPPLSFEIICNKVNNSLFVAGKKSNSIYFSRLGTKSVVFCQKDKIEGHLLTFDNLKKYNQAKQKLRKLDIKFKE